MKITPKDQKMFQNLSRTEIGEWLLDYSRRVQDYAHDSRGWEGDENKDSAKLAARLIEKSLVEKIRPKSKDKPIVEDDYE